MAQQLKIKQHNPAHPGSIIKYDILPALGVKIQDAAVHLKITRVHLSRIINGHSPVSKKFAKSLKAWLGAENGCSAESWLKMQETYDAFILESK